MTVGNAENVKTGGGVWQPIETAPRDGTPIQARIPGHGADNIIAWHGGLADEAGMECSTWCFVTEQEPPDDWTDGWCWEVNEDGCRSQGPTHWMPIAAPPEDDPEPPKDDEDEYGPDREETDDR